MIVLMLTKWWSFSAGGSLKKAYHFVDITTNIADP